MKTHFLKLTAFLLILAGILVSCKEKEVTEEPPPVEHTIELELGVYKDQGGEFDGSALELIDRETLALRYFSYPDVYLNYVIVKDSIKLTDISFVTYTYWFHVINSTEFKIEWANEQISIISTFKKIN